jgi:hypothetical protein
MRVVLVAEIGIILVDMSRWSQVGQDRDAAGADVEDALEFEQ